MPIMSKEILSGSTNGRGKKVTGTDTSGAVTLHTVTSGGSGADIDEIFIYATNTSASQVKLTIEFGGTTSPDDHIVANIPAETTVLVVPGLILKGGVVVEAFAGTGNVITCHGFVIRIDIS